jgi:hypothetical protein
VEDGEISVMKNTTMVNAGVEQNSPSVGGATAPLG